MRRHPILPPICSYSIRRYIHRQDVENWMYLAYKLFVLLRQYFRILPGFVHKLFTSPFRKGVLCVYHAISSKLKLICRVASIRTLKFDASTRRFINSSGNTSSRLIMAGQGIGGKSFSMAKFSIICEGSSTKSQYTLVPLKLL